MCMSTWQDLKDNPRLQNIYNTRIKIIRLIREFFWSKDFVETDTPLAVRFPGQEPYLNPMPITIHDPSGKEEKFYLHTSPEYALKKLLCVGWTKIFEICKCFRDVEEFGGTHNPEFTMIEWYRAPGTYQDFMDDMENLFKYVGEKLGIRTMKYKDREVQIFTDWDRMTMKSVWQKFINVDLDKCLTLSEMIVVAKDRGYGVGGADRYEDIFFKIFLNEIEPKLGLERPLFIYDYPAQMTSLSKRCDYSPLYGERVECYIGGLELCNGYGELIDAQEQKKRLEEDRKIRQELGKETWLVDEDFIAALHSGMAEAGGIALGVDRMVLLFTGARDINEVIFQSVSDQIHNS